jgi:hypothetical protein
MIQDFSPSPSHPDFSQRSAEDQNAAAVMNWMVGFLLCLQAKYYIPDASINLLINFLFIFLSVAGRFSTFMKCLADIFPKSLSLLLKMANTTEQNFTKFVVCRKCQALYDYENCLEKIGTNIQTKSCGNILFPNHPYQSRRMPCNCPLLKNVEVKSGKIFLYPYKIYCYASLKSSLQKLFLRPSFYEQCQHWNKRPLVTDGSLYDVYDGAIWKEFEPLFLSSFTLGLMLNIDWFQPYTHTVSSVGVIYLTLMNLPRHLRSKRENVILVGIIPGPHEPRHDVNTYLGPLIEELLLFWKGVAIDILMPSGIEKRMLKCVLLCVSCDLPAARKTCGFLSHSATLGCSKCLKVFPGSVGSMDYSGFTRSAWPQRTNISHRENVEKINQCRSKSTQSKMESELGCRYSILLKLPYFDPVRMHVIDPMHNLYLGSGKHMMAIWKEKEPVLGQNYDKIQNIVDNISVPSDVGRIPQKIESGFSGFKADQFKNWINTYSIPALFDFLPSQSLECWRHFVLACRILCKHHLTTCDIDVADILLLSFCQKVEQLYGKSVITPNMHLHAHLKAVICDYGPMQEFWCFPFERFNGILGKQPSNNRSIEPQLMKRFLRDNSVASIVYPDLFQEDFSHCILSCKPKCVGSLSETISKRSFKLASKYTRAVLSPEQISGLKCLLSKSNSLYESATIDVNSIFMKYSTITLEGKIFSSAGKKKQPVVAMALWDVEIYGLPPTSLPNPEERNANIRPVNVHYYAKVVYSVNGNTMDDIFALVSWFFPHPSRYSMGKPSELWCRSIFEPVNFMSSFVPIRNVTCRCAHGTKLHENEHLLVVIPLAE